MDSDSGTFGLSHLASNPIALTYGTLLIGVLILLVILRVLFGSITVAGGVK